MLIWALLVLFVVLRLRAGAEPQSTDPAVLPIVRRRSALLLGGVLLACVLAGVTAQSGRFGLGLALAGPVFCLVLVAALLAAEFGVRPPETAHRRAAVHSRRPSDYIRGTQLVTVGGLFTATVAFLLMSQSDRDDRLRILCRRGTSAARPSARG
ncbi:hypothetical protein SAMN05216266_101716 [Amycolatopsis marina]|uniref:Uncharacterized protein n=1 Tax=Amycolatopsis marina TaxID=490629 RepID=A0A1I0W3V6_9PSEU|nr:hypothetical protein [Amycolatopsis marina]SFA83312.1 hypothetical protein SAMN05216266_101716 [Amycolatopsis marina]